jgi:hypothetical protein
MLSGAEGEDVSEEHAQMLLDAGAGAQAAAGAKRKVCSVEQSKHSPHSCAWYTSCHLTYRLLIVSGKHLQRRCRLDRT